jgi:hypothetical protein
MLQVTLRAAIALTLSVLVVACTAAPNHSPVVTAEAVRAIRLGMSRAQVEAILGPPVAVRDVRDMRSLQFTRTTRRRYVYPMVWVNFRNRVVVEVYVKRYVGFGWDNSGVYRLADDAGPTEAAEFASLFRD